MYRTTASRARLHFPATLKKVRAGGRVILFHRGKPIAALVSVGDLELLRTAEDRRDAEAARAALAEIDGDGTIPWADVKASAGL